MQTIIITKDKLLKQLKTNREDHKAIYELALLGWQNEVTNALEEAYKAAKAGDEYTTWFDLEEPVSHVKDYDEIIDRVKWHEADQISLDIMEFNRFVRDSWEWMPNFLNNAHTYTTSSSSSSSSSSGSSSRALLMKKMKMLTS